MGESSDDQRLRRDALQIALQLPMDTEEALTVLRLTEELVRGFLVGRCAEKPPPDRPPDRPTLRLV
jgi:hypothetical protein